MINDSLPIPLSDIFSIFFKNFALLNQKKWFWRLASSRSNVSISRTPSSQGCLRNMWMTPFYLCWHFSVSQCAVQCAKWKYNESDYYRQDFCLNWIILRLKSLTISKTLAPLNQHTAFDWVMPNYKWNG